MIALLWYRAGSYVVRNYIWLSLGQVSGDLLPRIVPPRIPPPRNSPAPPFEISPPEFPHPFYYRIKGNMFILVERKKSEGNKRRKIQSE